MTDPGFDWRTVVATLLPSDEATSAPLQRERHALGRDFILPILTDWSARHQLAETWRTGLGALTYETTVKTCVFTATMRTYDPTERRYALGFAKYVMWLSAVDLLLDDILMPDMVADAAPVEQRLALVDAVLSGLSEPLRANGLTDARARAAGLRPISDLAADAAVDIGPYRGDITNISGALSDVLDEAAAIAAEFGDSTGAFDVLVDEAAGIYGAGRFDIANALRWRTDGQLPTLDEYIANQWDYASSLLAPSFAFLPALAASESWAKWKPVATTCTRGMRLLNDSGSHRRDFTEGKPTSITILLAQAGQPTDRLYDQDDPRLRDVIEKLTALAEESMGDFYRRLIGISDIPPTSQPGHLLLTTSALFRAAYLHADFDLDEVREIQRQYLASA